MLFTTVDLLRCSLPILTRSFRELSAQPKQPETTALIDHCTGFAQVRRRSWAPKRSIPMALAEVSTRVF